MKRKTTPKIELEFWFESVRANKLSCTCVFRMQFSFTAFHFEWKFVFSSTRKVSTRGEARLDFVLLANCANVCNGKRDDSGMKKKSRRTRFGVNSARSGMEGWHSTYTKTFACKRVKSTCKVISEQCVFSAKNNFVRFFFFRLIRFRFSSRTREQPSIQL